jgi:hypothetical protein
MSDEMSARTVLPANSFCTPSSIARRLTREVDPIEVESSLKWDMEHTLKPFPRSCEEG